MSAKMSAVTMGVKQVSILVLLVCVMWLSRLCDASLAPALFILGDSTVDTGNQNFLISVIKSNYPPYGIDFVPPGPTGRFSNGKLAVDFFAEYLGLPYPVDFLSPSSKGSVLLTGVNVASSGSGYLDTTDQLLGVVSFTEQIDNLGKVKDEITQQIGQQATRDLFTNAIFLISSGSNDFLNNYNIDAATNPQQWQQKLLDSVNTHLLALYDLGARKVAIHSLGPLGCAPEQLNLKFSQDGKCIDSVNEPVVNFNVGLKSLVIQLRAQYADYELLYVNIYDLFMSFVTNPSSYGYTSSNTACCGEGPWKGEVCLAISDVCSNRDDFVFWDLLHPTQKTYEFFANGLISGDQSISYPTNIQSIL